MERITYIAQDAVRAFHEKNNQIINDKLAEVPASCAVLRIRLLAEELGELAVAVHNKDMVNIADGLADTKYVLLGLCVSYGMHLPDSFPEEHQLASMAKFPNDEDCALLVSRLFFFFGPVAKGIWQTNEKCEQHEWAHREQLFDAIVQLDECISQTAASFGIPLEQIFVSVHESNMSKRVSGTAGDGGKYGAGDNPKGEGYQPPQIEEILEARRTQEKTERVEELKNLTDEESLQLGGAAAALLGRRKFLRDPEAFAEKIRERHRTKSPDEIREKEDESTKPLADEDEGHLHPNPA